MEFENTSLLAESAGLDVSTEKGHKLNYSSSSSLKSKSTTAKIMSTLSSTLKKQEQKRLDTELKSRVKPHHQKQPMSAAERSATKKSLVILAAIFITSLAAMCYVYMICPELNESEKQHMKIPRDIQDAKMLAKVLDRYKDMYYFEVMFGVVVAYILYPFC
uniref:Transmembrane protein 41B n=1 Tax=Glossina palpalis gambiensis TaxID=67801 RepID=A0A1B0BGK0_9MUSC